jgi:hypothetical protein
MDQNVYLIKFCVQCSLVLHVLDEVGTLALVGRDDTDLIGFDAGLDEPEENKNKVLLFCNRSILIE